MFLENNYINLPENSEISSVYSYRNIITKFVNIFVKLYKENYIIERNKSMSNLYEDALIYSKYYLYYKTINCTYDDKIMEILSNVENYDNFISN